MSAPDLEGVCQRRLDDGAQQIVLDISALEYISSAGLRVVLAVAKRLSGAGGKFGLCGARGIVRETLDLAGIGSIVPVHDTVEDALDGEC